MWVSRNHYRLLMRDNFRLLADLREVRDDLRNERERNRVREEAILDRVLTKVGSRPVSPPEPVKPAIVPTAPKLSEEGEARRRDFIAEELEHRAVNGNPTPALRRELDDMFETWEKTNQ